MLKAVVDDLESVEEKYRDLYVEFQDGDKTRYRLKVEGIAEHPDARALKNALDRKKAQVRDLTDELNPLKDRVAGLPEDFDGDAYEELKGRAEGKGGHKDEETIRTEAARVAREAEEKKWKPKVEKAEGERDGFKAKLEERVKRDALDEQLVAAGVAEEYRRGARSLLMPVLKVVEEDGEFDVLAVDKDLGDIPLAEHVKTWASSDEGKAYVKPRSSEGGGATGGGSGGNPSNSTNNPWKPDTMNVTEQARLRRDEPELARKLMVEAGVIPK